MIENILRFEHRVACHVRIGVARGGCHLTKMLKYTMAPTAKKTKLDTSPFFSPGFAIPPQILEMRAKAYATLAAKAATHDEVFEWICASPAVNSYGQFEYQVDNGAAANPEDIQLARLSKFISRNAKDARKIVGIFIGRRNRQQNRVVNTKNWDFFMEESWASICTCPTPLGHAADLLWSVQWHDEYERLCKNSMSVIGNFAKNLYFDSFSDRKENIFGVGVKGTGKSTVLAAFENILHPDRVFTPSFDASAPFSALRDHHLLGCFQEFRCRPNISSSTLLLWTERKGNLTVDVKHEDPIHLPDGGPRCIFSGNYLTKCAGWQDEDIEALYDRAETFWWNRALPGEKRSQASRNKCKKCAISFLAWCSPELLNVLECKLGPLPRPAPRPHAN